MSVLRLALLAVVLAVVPVFISAPVHASLAMPDGPHTLSHIDHFGARGSAADTSGVVVASLGSDILPVVSSKTTARLPLAGWLLGALLVGLAAAEFRRSDTARP